MEDYNRRILTLLDKFEMGEATVEELLELDNWYNSFQMNDTYTDGLSDVQEMLVKERVFVSLRSRLNDNRVNRKRFKLSDLWSRIAIAAAIVVIISGLVFYNSIQIKEISQTASLSDIAPGKVGATLTLANGKKILLTDVANGEIAEEAGIRVTKTANGQLVYEIKGSTKNPGIINTLTTAKGETYILTLPDKSKVWLNAASSLTYSTVLNEHGVRRVKLEGEAYFEISKDKAHPFVVESKGQQVKVLGTHFNIQAYNNEKNIKTTLLEGSVRVTYISCHPDVVLKPNQQSVLSGSDQIEVRDVDTEEVMAWKNGYFRFNGENVESIMRKLARWYDIQVIYEGRITKEVYYGKVSRRKNISEVLNVLEKAQGVHFKIEGRRVTVME